MVLNRLRSAQKPARGAPAYSRFVNRPVGRLLAAGAYRAGLSPNQVTGISATFTCAALVVLATLHPNVVVGILVCLLLLVGYAFDSADGQVARLRGTSSLGGEWLDHMVDCAKITSMHLATLISVYRFSHVGTARYLLVPLGFCVVTTVLFFGMTLNDQMMRARAAQTGRPVQLPATRSSARALLLLPTDFGIVCSVYLFLGWRTGFLVLYAVLFAAHVAFLLLASVKWFKDIRALDGQTA